jgi:hypothetical protein
VPDSQEEYTLLPAAPRLAHRFGRIRPWQAGQAGNPTASARLLHHQKPFLVDVERGAKQADCWPVGASFSRAESIPWRKRGSDHQRAGFPRGNALINE